MTDTAEWKGSEPPTHRHYKGGLYRKLMEGLREHDLVPVTIYRAQKDGTVWVRPTAEFEDGRFASIEGIDPLPAPPASPTRDEVCCTVGYTWCKPNGHIPGGPLWMVEWLPNGYGPSMDDRLICTFFDTEGRWDGYGVKEPPPLIAAVKKAIEDHLRAHPEDMAGHAQYGPLARARR